MSLHILMNVVDEHEMRVAVIREGHLENIIHERLSDDGQHLGNIYKAKVANVEPSLDAAFLDLGGTKNGFIHVSDIRHDRGDKVRIEKILKGGDEITVQVLKEAIRDKGPCVSAFLSIPGRNLVLVQDPDAFGVSKKIEDHGQRKRLKTLLAGFEAPEGFGFIVRTAGAERGDEELTLDYEYLKRMWQEIDQRAQRLKAPACLYREADVVIRTLREQATSEVDSIVIDSERYYDEARAFAMVFMPELANRIQLHREDLPLFTCYGVEDRLAAIYDRKVALPSGGNIVIEQTEALVSIDVNSSKSRDAKNVAATALTTNLEAVHVISEQLALRDLGGLIMLDFIDMDDRAHQRLVQLALRRALLKDRARTQVAQMSRFGIIEMTRQRTRPSHKIVAFAECPTCNGLGQIKTIETFEIECMRAVRTALAGDALSRLEVVVPQDMAIPLLNSRHAEITGLERQYDSRITFVGDSLMKSRGFRLVPTKSKRRRGGGQERADSKPVHPGLLAPWLEAKAQAQAEVKELIKRGPASVEREVVAAITGRQEHPRASAESRPLEAPVRTAAPTSSNLPETVATLRELLFSPPTPMAVGSVGKSSLARGASSGKSPSPKGDTGGGNRRRRRRGGARSPRKTG